MMYYLYIGMESLSSFAILSFFLFTFYPCFPGNFGYFLLPECTHKEFDFYKNLSAKLVLAIFSTHNMTFLIAYDILEVVLLSALPCFCFRQYILAMEESLLSLLHMNETSRLSQFKKIMSRCRSTEVLLNLYNSIQVGILTCTETTMLSLALVISMYVLVSGYKTTSLVIILIATIITLEVVLIILEVDGNMKSKVYEFSKKFLHIVRRQAYAMKQPFTRRQVRSLRTMRIYITNVNFYESTTSLQLLSLNISLTINLLLA